MFNRTAKNFDTANFSVVLFLLNIHTLYSFLERKQIPCYVDNYCLTCMAVWLILIYVKEITQKTREQRIRSLIASSKFLNDTKYFKTNKVSVAAYDSWAAKGQVGGCSKC